MISHSTQILWIEYEPGRFVRRMKELLKPEVKEKIKSYRVHGRATKKTKR